jgi:hypothetical protein
MTRTVYVVIEHDRHRDPEPYVFDDHDEALGFARGIASDWLEEWHGEILGKRLFLAMHPSESDAVWVVERTINDQEDRLR